MNKNETGNVIGKLWNGLPFPIEVVKAPYTENTTEWFIGIGNPPKAQTVLVVGEDDKKKNIAHNLALAAQECPNLVLATQKGPKDPDPIDYDCEFGCTCRKHIGSYLGLSVKQVSCKKRNASSKQKAQKKARRLNRKNKKGNK